VAGSELTLSFRGDGEGITVTGRVAVSDSAPPLDPDELSEQVLDAVVDSHRYSVDGTEIQFTMFRGRRPSET
jgi:hypothetical protein